jgi:hypothetical protein
MPSPATVSADQLKALVGSPRIASELQLFMDLAERTTNRLLADKGLADDLIGDISLQLAGHFYVVSVERGGIHYMENGMAKESYNDLPKTDIGYMSTRFGQTACVLDTTGTLRDESKAAGVRYSVVSVKSKSQEPYRRDKRGA